MNPNEGNRTQPPNFGVRLPGMHPSPGISNPNPGQFVRPIRPELPEERDKNIAYRQNNPYLNQPPLNQNQQYQQQFQNHPQQQQNLNQQQYINRNQNQPQQQFNRNPNQQQFNLNQNHPQQQYNTPQPHPQQQQFNVNQNVPQQNYPQIPGQRENSANLQNSSFNRQNAPNMYNQRPPPENQRTHSTPQVLDPSQSVRGPDRPTIPSNQSGPQLGPQGVLNQPSQRIVKNEDLKDSTQTKPEKDDTPVSKEPETNTEENSDVSSVQSEPEENEPEETEVKPQPKEQKKSQKELGESKEREDDNITKGIVQNTVKYFEEHDTAKLPLMPKAITVEKKEKKVETHPNVVRGDSQRDDYESGVDETPVVHCKLRNIFQNPRKVAKIPRVRKNYKKHKPFVKYSGSGFQQKFGSRNFQNIKTYGSNEELLAFFDNSKPKRRLTRHTKSASDQNTTKDQLVCNSTTNGDISPKKTPSKLPAPLKKNLTSSPTKPPLKSPGRAKSLPRTPETPSPTTPLIKKVPMNKIQVGAAPSPNLKVVKSKVGSLANTTHKPGGGNVKIESHKIDVSKTQPRIEAKNEQYKPSGGDKKITQVKLQWSAKPKIGSLENATYKPGGGDKKIESVKLDFKEKAKPKVGSKDNVKHVPGGGNVKIENQKLEFKAQSKVGSLDNVKHKPGGGEIKIFDDKTYLRQISGNSSEGRASGAQSPMPTSVSKTFSETSQNGS